MPYTAKVDKKSCQSSGRCVAAEPEAFGLDEDHLAETRSASSRLRPERLIEIAKRCPALAISVYDETGREVDLDAG